MHYRCEDGTDFSVAFHRDDTASIEFRGMTFPLRHEPSGSGAKYSCDVLTFWTKGDEALLEVQGSPMATNCRAMR